MIGRTSKGGVGVGDRGGMLGSPKDVGTKLVVEGAASEESSEDVIVPVVGGDNGVVCVDEAVVRESTDEEPGMVEYPAEVEVGLSEVDVEVSTGIGENGCVMKLTMFDWVAVPRAVEVSETSVVEQPVGSTVTVTVTRVVGLSLAVEVAALDVRTEVSEVVSVDSTSVKLSPTGKLNSGMSDRAGVLVGLELVLEEASAVGVPVVSAVVEVAALVSVVIDDRISDKLSPTGMLNSGMSEEAGTLVEVPVSTAVVVVATEVLEGSSSSPFPLEGSSPSIPPVAPVSAIRAKASSGAAHETVYRANGESQLFPHYTK